MKASYLNIKFHISGFGETLLIVMIFASCEKSCCSTTLLVIVWHTDNYIWYTETSELHWRRCIFRDWNKFHVSASLFDTYACTPFATVWWRVLPVRRLILRLSCLSLALNLPCGHELTCKIPINAPVFHLIFASSHFSLQSLSSQCVTIFCT